ncbi:hypothetical protein [Morganella morganii]|uniref:hypothetical protein n=1 Tax=Morganella morganii TaxID=582 RepID=UPI0030FE295B
MISVDVNDNYLECRQYYAVLFSMLSVKTLLLEDFYKMIIEARGKNVNTLISELNQHVGNVLNNVDHYLREVERKTIPIEQLSFFKG